MRKHWLERRWLRQFPFWGLLLACLIVASPARAAAEFLEPEQAFRLSVQEQSPGQMQLRWSIAPGYYLYRNRIGVSGAGVGEVTKPLGEPKEDPNFGTVEVYHNAVQVQVATGTAASLRVTWQGCADDGLCYPPQEKEVALTQASQSAGPAVPAAAAAPAGAGSSILSVANSDADFSRLLQQRSLAWTLPLFFLLGMALAFTPCVLPMVPILSSMVVGSGAKPRRGLLLSLAFVGPMAAVYAGMGVLAALAGAGLQAWLQNPWTLLSFAAVFIALALAMFGFYELQLPTVLRERLANKNVQGGSLGGAAGMGALSALLVGPCMTAPLAGTLLYIAQGGSTVEGGLLLLSLGLGMGVPLIVISTLGARWLPRPGAWMDRVKAGFGFILLGTAIWMASRVVAAQWTLLMWGFLLVAFGLSLWQMTRSGQAGLRTGPTLVARSGAALAGLWGVAMVFGAAAGASDPAQPLRTLVAAPSAAAAAAPAFETLEDPTLLQARLADAAARGQPALIEFSADWCTSCKTIERKVFGDPRVGRALDGVLLLRADVTRSDAAQRAFMQQHQVMGPPTLMLYGSKGGERREQRLVGEFGPEALLQRLQPGSTGS
jgi:thioredoxin:protein disulfide reductase